MSKISSKTNMKRLSKSLRLHIRRLKQEARKEGTIYRAPIFKRVPEKKNGE